MTATPRFDVAVVGAGPAGSATAALLAERGCSVALLDRAVFPRPKPCAEYLGPGAVRLLRRLRVLDALRRLPHATIRGMRISCGDVSFAGRFPHSETGLGISRIALDAALVAAAAERGAAVYQQATVAQADWSGDQAVWLTARRPAGPIRLAARLLVGADGLHSRIARQLGVARRGHRRRVALVAHATGVPDLLDVGQLHVAPVGYLGLAPIGQGVTNLALVVDLARAAPRQPLEDALRVGWEHFPAARDQLAAGALAGGVRAVGPFASHVRRASARRTVLVGDAADFYDPFTGEGVYAALRGAFLIADVITPLLHHDRLDARDLRAYDRARRRTFAAKWALERLISWLIARPGAFRRVARYLCAHPSLADRLVRRTGHAAHGGLRIADCGLFRGAMSIRNPQSEIRNCR